MAAILDKVSWRLILRTVFYKTFLKKIDTFLRKLTVAMRSSELSERTSSEVARSSELSERYKQRSDAKRYKHYTFESKESSTMLFSAITTYFQPLYYQLFGILYAIFP